VIPNQNLFRVATEKTTFAEAFVKADQVLYSGVACIVDLIVKDGLINLDFADVRTIMTGMGNAMMATGEGRGEARATAAAEEAISNPLLDDVSLKGAKGLLLSIIGGRDMTLYEVDEAASRIRQEVDPEANIIVGATFADDMENRIRVAIVASGMARDAAHAQGHVPAHGRPPMGQPPMGQPPFPPSSRAPGREGRPVPRSSFNAPSHPSSKKAADGEVRQRLAEAIRAARGEDAAPEDDLQDGPRELWRAPGDVVIEEAEVPRGELGRQLRPPPMPSDRQPPAGFNPAAPQPLKRSRSRIPEVEEFPPIAQHEYRMRAGRDPEAPLQRVRQETDVDNEPPRKRGLIQRLVDAGRGRRPDHEILDRNERQPPDNGEDPPAFIRRNKS